LTCQRITVRKIGTRKENINLLKGPVTLLTVAFLVSRALAYYKGVTFYGSFIHRFWQSIDIELLRHDMVRSIWYSHAQPPFFNFLNGILVKIFPAHYPLLFQLINLSFSWTSAVLLYYTLRNLKLGTASAVILSLFFLLSPAVVLYENLYSYTTFTVFLVTLLAFSLTAFIRTKDTAHWALFVSTFAVLVLTRSSFHLFFMIAFFAVLLAAPGLNNKRRFRCVLIAIAPCVIAGSWYVKNKVLFDTFSASSWLGMNLARVAPPEPGTGIARPFKSLDAYPDSLKIPIPFSDVPLLNSPYKSVTGYINFNHYHYLPIADAFKRRAVSDIKRRPGQYLRNVGRSFIIYFAPATHAPFTDINLRRMGMWPRIMTADFSGFEKYSAIPSDTNTDDPVTIRFMVFNHLTLTDAIPAFLVWVIVITSTLAIWYRKKLDPDETLIVLALLLVLTYGMLVGNFLEFGENNRFRFETSPLLFVLAAFPVRELMHSLTARAGQRFYYFFKRQ
jgi:hypothetical protein